jgi:signal transduction histidine kinase
MATTQRRSQKLENSATRTNIQIGLLCMVLAIGIFIVDIASLPLGVAAGVAYVAVVLISLSLSRWYFSLFVAGIVSALTIFGFLYSEPAGVTWMVITNRVLALLAIWLTAIIGGWLIFSKRRKAASALVSAEEEAARARNSKFRFLESTSNEMRQHLQTMSLLTATMRKMATDPKLQEVCVLQDDAVARLGGLLNSILEIYELESGEVQPELAEVSIQDVFETLHSEFELQAQTKGLQLTFSAPGETALTDSTLLKRIVRSLISNAIQFADEGSVDVSCRRVTNGLRVVVSDTGVGIAPDEIEAIFDEFYRVNSDPVDRNAGRGLGLAVVDRGLKLLDTEIEVESKPGQGSSFSFVVPQFAYTSMS